MSIFDWFKRKPNSNAVKSQNSDNFAHNINMINSLATNAGSVVDPMKIEAVFSCLRDKSEITSRIPLKLYKTSSNERELIKTGRKHQIFTKKPNDYMTMQQFMSFAVTSLERYGAFYAYKRKNDIGSVMEIIPFKYQGNILPHYDQNGNVYYVYTTNDNRSHTNYHLDDLVIVRGMTIDGITPVSPMAYNAVTLGIMESQQKNYRELQENGITSQMALATDNVFNDANALKTLQEDWKNYRGSKGYSKTPIFENGIKPVSLKLTPQETELLQHQEFTVNRICRIFRVPLHRVGLSTNTTDDVFALDEAYFRDVIETLLVSFEDAFNQIVGDGYELQFNRKAFYAGSPFRLVESVERELKGGLCSVNEGRIDLGREPLEGGDVFVVDNNNVVYSTWDKLPEVQAMLYNQNNQETVNNNEDSENENQD